MTEVIAYGVAALFILQGIVGFARTRRVHQNLLSRAKARHATGRALAGLDLFFLDMPVYVSVYRLLCVIAFCVGCSLLWALCTHTLAID
ncbi:hypothetical protein [Nitrospirillum viridazoti]|uniref:Uncharacterized protein n=1 Tax=Nitrospirillum amazonense TaxID=28077 RepID=A0A560IPY7_9PROT|nr:hypothetical protein [Nitrospirillum amazonense]TWB60501.1 hypothetical protein FBZ92_10662 [Nitrospirillum amazonense]